MTDKRKLGAELLEGIREIQRYKAGKAQLKVTRLSVPAAPDVIRNRLGLSQSQFAALMGVSVRTLQDWEQGRRTPKGPAMALLRIADQFPEVFIRVR